MNFVRIVLILINGPVMAIASVAVVNCVGWVEHLHESAGLNVVMGDTLFLTPGTHYILMTGKGDFYATDKPPDAGVFRLVYNLEYLLSYLPDYFKRN